MDGIIKKIKSETRDRIKSIEKLAEEEEMKIFEMARKEALAEARQIKENAKKRAELEKNRIVSAANLEAKKKKAELIDGILEKWISRALERIEELRRGKQYSKALSLMIKEAVEEIPSGKVLVLVSPEDKPKIKALKAGKKTVQIKASGEVKTGAIIRALNGSVEINATLPRLLENKKAKLKKELFNYLMD